MESRGEGWALSAPGSVGTMGMKRNWKLGSRGTGSQWVRRAFIKAAVSLSSCAMVAFKQWQLTVLGRTL